MRRQSWSSWNYRPRRFRHSQESGKSYLIMPNWGVPRYTHPNLHMSTALPGVGKIEDFLKWLSEDRDNSVSTINQRLAVIHAFFDYVRMEDPRLMLHCQSILAIPFRRAPKPCVSHLTAPMLQSILSYPDLSTPQVRRDLVLMSVLYDTGARVQEIVDLAVRDVHLDAPASITLHRKGQKIRIVPIMRQTVSLLQNYMAEKRVDSIVHCNEPLFQNRRRQKLTRAGISYILNKYANIARAEHPKFPKRLHPTFCGIQRRCTLCRQT